MDSRVRPGKSPRPTLHRVEPHFAGHVLDYATILMQRFEYFRKTRHGRTFTVVWIGQLVSTLGSAMTPFGLAIWVFAETGSAFQISLVVLASTLPSITMSPLVGVLVDRWDRRTAMIVSDTGAAVGTLAIAVLFAIGALETWHLYIALAFSSVFGSFQFPAYSAATTLLVPKDEYGRAAGMVQLAGSIGRVGAPALAGALILWAGPAALFMVDFATFVFAIGTLLVVRFPKPESSANGPNSPAGLLSEAREGFGFLTANRGLLVLLLTFSIVNVAYSFQSVLLIPLLLSLTSEAIVGLVVSTGALGLVGGSLIMGVWGGSADRRRDLFVGLAMMGFGIVLIGTRPDLLLVLVGITVLQFALPVANGSSQAMWQAKVPVRLQGRVFAFRQMFGWGAMPVSYLLAGVLADRVFEPLFRPEGTLGQALGRFVGTGDGRGIGFLIMLMGLLVLVVSLKSWRSVAIRDLHTNTPDIDHRNDGPTNAAA